MNQLKGLVTWVALSWTLICERQSTWAVDINDQGPDSGSWNVSANWNNFAPPDVAFNEAAIINNGATVVLNDHTKTSPDGGPPFVDVSIGGLRLGSAANVTGGLRIVSGGVLEAVPHTGGLQPPETGAISVGAAGTGALTILGNGVLSGTSFFLGGSIGSSITLSDAASLNLSGAASLQRITTIVGPNVNFIAGGDLTLGEESTLIADIRHFSLHSQLKTSGAASISGVFRPKFTGVTPTLGNKWTLIDAAVDVTGTFNELDFSMAPSLPTGQTYRVTRSNQGDRKLLQFSVETISQFSSDFDEDGDVDADDLVQWQGDFGVNGDSDAEGDGDSDGADFLAWQQQLGSGVMAATAGAAAPEPCTAVLFGLATSVAATLNRRRGSWGCVVPLVIRRGP
jgi:hypothetical protein